MKVIQFLILFLFARTIVQAQTDTNENKEKLKTERAQFEKELNLTTEQKRQLKDIKTKQHAEMLALKNNSKLTEEQKKEEFKAVKKQYRTQKETVFTAEQKEKMKNFHKSHPREKGMKHKRKMNQSKVI